MFRKKILIPLAANGWNLNGVHYALALAERIGARIYILQQHTATQPQNSRLSWFETALKELISGARQAGLEVSHHITGNGLAAEIVAMERLEGIDVLVLNADDEICRHLLRQIKPLVASQIIEVRGKNHISYLGKEENRDGHHHDFESVSGRRATAGARVGPQDQLASAQPGTASGRGPQGGDQGGSS